MMLKEHPSATVGKKVTGNVIIAQAASEAELVELLKKDVYAKVGIWNSMDKVSGLLKVGSPALRC